MFVIEFMFILSKDNLMTKEYINLFFDLAEKISSFMRKIEYLASVDELMPIAFDILKYTDECV